MLSEKSAATIVSPFPPSARRSATSLVSSTRGCSPPTPKLLRDLFNRGNQYAIVHKYLFEAMVEVLGEAITPKVAQAWNEVYWLMANALIAIESRLYAEAGAADGDTWREYRVVGRYEETADGATFLVRPVDDGALPPARPWQYTSRCRWSCPTARTRSGSTACPGPLRTRCGSR
ncbi:hypothetical protein ABZV93_24105 [Actinopolymorpha sp. NPDC004070]|uniref:hypothetical protein n=1 Tax=Actinopolymorpha sp. NPDC004070 TaxID=3154548 RepID=UPI0033ACF439